MSYILEALRKVEQQREHLPAHGLSSRRRYYSAIDARFWSRPWALVIAAIAAASLSGGVVAFFVIDDDAVQQTSALQQEPKLAAQPHPAVPVPPMVVSADDYRQTEMAGVAKSASGAAPALQPVRPAALRMPGPRYQPPGTIAVQPQDKARVQPQGPATVTKNEQAQESKPADDPAPTPEPEAPPETKQPVSPEDEPETEVASLHPAPNGVKPPRLPAAAQERALNTLPKGSDSLDDMIPPPKAVEVQPFRPNDVIRPPAAKRNTPSGNSATGEPPMLSTLPSQFQSIVPKLAINAQVYSAVPAQRFVVINMKRYNEGQSTSEGVNVVAIRQQDIVFSFQGQRFRLGR